MAVVGGRVWSFHIHERALAERRINKVVVTHEACVGTPVEERGTEELEALDGDALCELG